MEAFYNRRATVVAPDLLGKVVVTKGGRTGIITETEAYDGPQDRASHAFAGRTPRAEVMFGPAGHFYVYRIYGIHWMLNVVTGPVDYPAAVLIRGLYDTDHGIHYDGPGKVTAFLHVDQSVNRKPVDQTSGLWIEDRGVTVERVERTPRIGIASAGPVWSKKLYRFLWKGPFDEAEHLS